HYYLADQMEERSQLGPAARTRLAMARSRVSFRADFERSCAAGLRRFLMGFSAHFEGSMSRTSSFASTTFCCMNSIDSETISPMSFPVPWEVNQPEIRPRLAQSNFALSGLVVHS